MAITNKKLELVIRSLLYGLCWRFWNRSYVIWM